MENIKANINFQSLFEALPGLFLVLKPDSPRYTIVAASDAYLKATHTGREHLIGGGLFEIFPDNQNDGGNEGARNLQKSLAIVLKNKAPHKMEIQKHETRLPRPEARISGERHWNAVNAPLFNKNGEIEYIIHRVDDVTEFILWNRKAKEEIEQAHAELEKRSLLIKNNQERINDILNVLLKYTVMDFTEKISITENADELDAIAVGLNTLGEELLSHIRQLKESEEAVRVSQKIFSTVFFKSPVMNSITDAKTGQFIEVNDNFAEFCGFKKEEIIGRSSLDLHLIPHPKHRLEIIKGINEQGYSRDILMEITNKAGETKWVSSSAHAVNINGKDCFITAMIDITERKKVQDQLLAVNKELESFSYSVSHDLRAPLRAIDGYAKIMEEDYGKILDEEGNRLLEVVQYNAKKMGSLIDDLLAFSRLGKKELTKTVLNMNELVEGALYELNKSVKHNANVKIKYLDPVRGDYGLINQVVVNLLSNAIKYSSKVKEPFIEISSEKDGEDVIYSVKDNGAGFDMRYVGKLFGVFQRLHTMDEFEGTGVGLAIVQRIISKHGGIVSAKGEKDKGATFQFSLPGK